MRWKPTFALALGLADGGVADLEGVLQQPAEPVRQGAPERLGEPVGEEVGPRHRQGLGQGGHHMGGRGEPPLPRLHHRLVLRLEVQAQGRRPAGASRQRPAPSATRTAPVTSPRRLAMLIRASATAPSPGEPAPSPAKPGAPYDAPGPLPRHGAARLAGAAAATVLVVGLVLFGGQLLSTSLTGGDPGEEPSGNPTSGETQQPRRGPLEIASATTLDPPPDGNGEENSDRAGRAVDGDESSAWPTKTYHDPFGPSGLKEGVGLLLDLGEVRAVSRVEVTVQGGATDFELRVADEAGDAPGVVGGAVDGPAGGVAQHLPQHRRHRHDAAAPLLSIPMSRQVWRRRQLR
mgnify:CR=1 FL=1